MGRHDATTGRERLDRSCELLASECRRRVIYALREGGPATVDELADGLVAAGLVEARKRALVSLLHTHLPKLDDYGVVEYDGRDEEVSLAEGVEPLEPLLAVAAREETATGPEGLSLPTGSVTDPVGGPRSD